MEGLFGWPNPDAALLAFIVTDGRVYDTSYNPTMEVIKEKCDQFGLHFDTIREAILRQPECHTFLIDAELFRAANPKE